MYREKWGNCAKTVVHTAYASLHPFSHTLPKSLPLIVAHAPIAVMLMVAEMTGNLSMLAPAMIAVGIASALLGKSTIYTSQVETRADSPAHRT